VAGRSRGKATSIHSTVSTLFSQRVCVDQYSEYLYFESLDWNIILSIVYILRTHHSANQIRLLRRRSLLGSTKSYGFYLVAFSPSD
jgi:hypothetical protein